MHNSKCTVYVQSLIDNQGTFRSHTHIHATRDLVFNFFGWVGEEDGGGGVAGTHLGLRPLQGWEEGGMEQSRFVEAKPRGHITCHAEIGVLVCACEEEEGGGRGSITPCM